MAMTSARWTQPDLSLKQWGRTIKNFRRIGGSISGTIAGSLVFWRAKLGKWMFRKGAIWCLLPYMNIIFNDGDGHIIICFSSMEMSAPPIVHRNSGSSDGREMTMEMQHTVN